MGCSRVEIEITERQEGGTEEDCRQRCKQVIATLQADATRATHVSSTKTKSTVHGGAAWGDEAQLRRAGYITAKPEATRLIIGKTQKSEFISIPELVTNAHAIVCGRTGVGKSRRFFIPNLIERLGSNMIVTEATPGYEAGELYTLTSGWRKQAGHTIYSFNPADMSSTRINPVDRVRWAPELEKAKEAEKLADLIIMNGSGEEARIDPTWNFLLDYLLDSKSTMKYPTSLFLDEFTNFGKIANIANVLSIVRKAKLSLVLGFQNYFQLERVYSQKEAQIIFDQPATQIYFQQKNFREARALSEALRRTTIEEVTVSDTGRVQEFVQGRSLATPDELINLSGEVIAFTNDTWPLKIPLTSPTAYQYALAYPPPERPPHQISESIRKRGRTEQPEINQQKEESKPEGKNRSRERNRSEKKRNFNQRAAQERANEDNTNQFQEQDSPEVDDVWPS